MTAINRPAWRTVAKAASDLNIARRLAARSRLQVSDADARRRFALAMDAAPPIPALNDGHNWATLEVLGVTRDTLPAILEALGAPENAIKEAMTDPDLAYQMLKEYGRNYKEQQQ